MPSCGLPRRRRVPCCAGYVRRECSGERTWGMGIRVSIPALGLPCTGLNTPRRGPRWVRTRAVLQRVGTTRVSWACGIAKKSCLMIWHGDRCTLCASATHAVRQTTRTLPHTRRRSRRLVRAHRQHQRITIQESWRLRQITCKVLRQIIYKVTDRLTRGPVHVIMYDKGHYHTYIFGRGQP